MRSCWKRWCVALGCVALAACSNEEPTAPTSHSLTGKVRLTGYLVNEDGTHGGTRVVENASGVQVELLHGNTVVGRTTTVDGTYRFSGLAPGDYVARSRVVGTVGDQTVPLVIASTDIVSGDPLDVASSGDLVLAPNPMVDTVQVHFGVPAGAMVEIKVVDLGGGLVRTLLASGTAQGRWVVLWGGVDEHGQPATAAMYWVTYQAGPDFRAHLVFRQ